MYKFSFFNDKNGKKTICARSTFAGKTVKGYAKYNPEDEYDEEFGKALAIARCDVRVNERRLKHAEKRFSEAIRLYNEASKNLREADSYREYSRKRLNTAKVGVEILLDSLKTEN